MRRLRVRPTRFPIIPIFILSALWLCAGATGRAQPHRYRPDSGWITFPIQTEDDIEQAIELFHLAYEQMRGPASDSTTLNPHRSRKT